MQEGLVRPCGKGLHGLADQRTTVLAGERPDDGGLAGVAGNLSFEPLVSIGWNGKPTPKLAKSWEWSDDATRVRFELDPTVKFHDGSALTASIAREARGFRRWSRPAAPSNGALR